MVVVDFSLIFFFFYSIVAVVLVDFSLIFCVVTVLGLWALWVDRGGGGSYGFCS